MTISSETDLEGMQCVGQPAARALAHVRRSLRPGDVVKPGVTLELDGLLADRLPAA